MSECAVCNNMNIYSLSNRPVWQWVKCTKWNSKINVQWADLRFNPFHSIHRVLLGTNIQANRSEFWHLQFTQTKSMDDKIDYRPFDWKHIIHV